MVGITNTTSSSIEIPVKNLSNDKGNCKELPKAEEKNFFKEKLREKVDSNSKGKINCEEKCLNTEVSSEREESINSKLGLEEETKKSISEDKDEKELLSEDSQNLMSILEILYQLLHEKNCLDNTEQFKDQVNLDKKEKINDMISKTFDNLLHQSTKVNENDSKDIAKLKLLLENGEPVLVSQNAIEKLIGKIQREINKQVPTDKENLNVKDLIKFISEELEKEIKSNEPVQKNIDVAEYITNRNNITNTKLQNNTLSREESFLKNLIEHGEKHNEPKNKDVELTKLTNLGEVNKFSSIDKNVSVEVNENKMVAKANIVQDMVKSIKYMENNNLKNLTVKVMPKELGEIVIRLTMESGKIKLALNATNKETYSLLNSNLGEISEKLTTANLKIQPAEINVYNGDTTFFSGQFMGDNQREGNEGTKYNSTHSNDNVAAGDEQETMVVDENYNGNLNTKV